MKKLRVFILFTLSSSLFTLCSAQTGKWSAVKNVAPHYHNGGLVLLTDGTVLCHTTDGGGNGTGWDRLTPDAHGSYANGTWSSIKNMVNDRLYFSSQVLQSGKVYVAGGEYGAGGTNGEVYDPKTDTWTMCDTIPAGWNMYDGNSEILYDGTVLEGPQVGSYYAYNNLIWDPKTNQYSIGANSIYDHDEASWLKLRDSSILFVGIGTQYSNRYIPQTKTWVLDDTLPGMLYDPYGYEAGGSFLMPDGRAIFFGATNYNAFYTPSGNNKPGKWTSAASFPDINGEPSGQPDGCSAMMVNGHILLAVSPVGDSTGEFKYPCYFLEYNCATGVFTRVTDTIPGVGYDSIQSCSYQVNMIDLPDGTVLVSNYQHGYSNQYWIYTPGSGPIPQGKPTINRILPDACPSYKITGKLFNGISEGASYGDDWQMETNYPIVRLTDGTNVYYTTTSDWNRVGAVRTDSLEDTAVFTLPAGLPAGTYSLVVVANGFASNPVLFTTLSASVSAGNVDCMGGTGVATAFANGGLSPFTYLWNPGGSTKATATGLSAGTYTLTVTDNNGCVVNENITITQPASALAATINAVSTSGPAACDGSAQAIPTGGTAPYTYRWTTGGQSTDTINNQCAGNYCCIVTDNHGCTQTVCANIVTAISDLKNSSNEILIYPNPNNGSFVLGITNYESGMKYQVEIYNVLGEKVYSQYTVHSSSFIVDLQSKSNGLYFYRVLKRDGNLLGEGKIIIQK